MRFRAIVVTGNKKGKVGLGTGKASEVQAAVQKAASAARRNMIRIPIIKGTIPHEVEQKFKAAKIRILPAMEGTGIIAGGALRVILENAGIQNILSKQYGTSNKLVNAQAAMMALSKFRGTFADNALEETARTHADAKAEKSVKANDLEKEMANARFDREVLEAEQLGVLEVSREDVDEEGTLKVKSE